MGENRSGRRQRALQSGKIAFANGSFVVDCVVRNFSETGAQLKVPTSVAIPDCFDFTKTGAKPRRAIVVWRKGDLMGVKFEG